MLDKITPPKKILLVEPPFFRLFGYRRWHYPMTLTLIGTYLDELGHDVRVCDLDKPTPECREYSRTEAGDNYYKSHFKGWALLHSSRPGTVQKSDCQRSRQTADFSGQLSFQRQQDAAIRPSGKCCPTIPRTANCRGCNQVN